MFLKIQIVVHKNCRELNVVKKSNLKNIIPDTSRFFGYTNEKIWKKIWLYTAVTDLRCI